MLSYLETKKERLKSSSFFEELFRTFNNQKCKITVKIVPLQQKSECLNCEPETENK